MSHIEVIELTSHGIPPEAEFEVVITTDDDADGKKLFYFEAVAGGTSG